MGRSAKLGLVIGGDMVACLVATAAVYIYQLFTQNAAAQASAGMYAFSDYLIFIGMLAVLALFPTGLVNYSLLRSFQAG